VAAASITSTLGSSIHRRYARLPPPGDERGHFLLANQLPESRQHDP
jgi:hypothetical protein